MVLKKARLLLTLDYIGVLFFFHKKKETIVPEKPVDTPDASMICKFVLDGTGKKLGESVSVNHDVLIIKSGSQFLGVPLKHVEPVGKTLVVKGLLNFTKAYELGEKWRKESYREMNQHDPPTEKPRRF